MQAPQLLEFINVLTFTPRSDLNKLLEEISVSLRKELSFDFIFPTNYFNLPSQIDLPLEIPRMSMETQQGDIRLQLTGNQFSIAINSTAVKDNLELIKNTLNKVYEILISKDFKVTRIGCVAKYIQNEPKPTELIKRNFLSNSSNDLTECFIRLIQRKDSNTIKHNVVFNIETAINNIDQELCLLITLDINTLPEDTSEKGKEKLFNFLNFTFTKYFNNDYLNQRIAGEYV